MKLNDTQLLLLSTASQRDNGSLIPTPDTLTAPADRVRKTIAALIKAGFAEEGEVQDAALAWRIEGDANFGARITGAGRAAIGLEAGDSSEPIVHAAAQTPPAEKKQTKTSRVLALLQRESGATLDEMIAATDWLPHTTRAALTGLRKQGYHIQKGKRGDVTCYTISAKAE